MKRFRFPLDTLLGVRRLRRTASRQAAEARARAAASARARVRAAEARIADLLADTHARIMRGGTAAEATVALGLLRAMSGQLEACRDECARADAALEEAREAVRARHRETRVVEILRARAALRHRADEEREAVRDADDMTLSRLTRPRREDGA